VKSRYLVSNEFTNSTYAEQSNNIVAYKTVCFIKLPRHNDVHTCTPACFCRWTKELVSMLSNVILPLTRIRYPTNLDNPP